MSTQLPQPAAPPQNELAHWFTDFQRKVEPHTNKIVLAILLATVGLVAYLVLTRSAAAKTNAAWTKYYACNSAEDFKRVAEDNAGNPVEPWARLEAARSYINSGIVQAMVNRKASNESLENGREQLETLLKSDSISPDLRELALVQMATCLESLCDGDVKPVTEAYQKLLDKFPGSHYAPWAKNRLEVLQKPETAEFYGWFQKAQPAPPERMKPKDALHGEVPNLKSILDDPAPPETGTDPKSPLKEDPAAPETPEKPAAENPAKEDPAKAPEAPAAEKHAEKAPEKPAEPAEETPAKPAKPDADPAKPAEPAKPEDKEAPKP